MAVDRDVVEYDNLRFFVTHDDIATNISPRTSPLNSKLKRDKKCGAYMYVDLFPTLRMKRDILEAKRNLRKVNLSNSAESIIEQNIGERKLTRMNSASYESIILPEVASPKTKKRFKHAFSRLVQNFSRSSSKPDLQKEERSKDVPSEYTYPSTVIEPVVKRPTGEGYDRLHTWSPFIAAEKDVSQSSNLRKEHHDENQERRYQLPTGASLQGQMSYCALGRYEILEKFDFPEKELSTKKNRQEPGLPVCKVPCNETEQELVGKDQYKEMSTHDHVTMHCRRQNLAVKHLVNERHILHKA